MSLSAEQKKEIIKAQDEAKKLLIDKAAFEKAFEEVFTKYDRNRDQHISMGEYVEFLKDMLQKSGRKNYDLPVAMLNFERADKDSDGNIDKAEFKKEFLKRIREFASHKIK